MSPTMPFSVSYEQIAYHVLRRQKNGAFYPKPVRPDNGRPFNLGMATDGYGHDDMGTGRGG